MTENEEIKKVINGLNFLKEKLYNGIYADRLDCIDYAISALKEIQQYHKIGTVEECRDAVEKQTQKKCAIDSCPDHTHYKCPSCGQIELSIYKHGFPRLGRITKYCENCGQALIDEN